MKKKLLAAGIVLLLIAGAIWWFMPRPLVEADYTVHVMRTGETLEDVTDQVDCEKLAELLQGYTCGHFRRSFAPFQLSESTVEISGMDSRGVWHILLCEDARVVYQSSDQGGYLIHNSEELWSAVLEMIP